MINHVFVILGNDQLWMLVVLSMFQLFYMKLTGFTRKEREREGRRAREGGREREPSALPLLFLMGEERERSWVKLEEEEEEKEGVGFSMM